MKRQLFAGAAFACLALAAPAASAQSMNLKASIPFEFSVGAQTYPAGEYSITKLISHPFFVVQNLNSEADHGLSMVNPKTDRKPGNQEWVSSLVFDRYGNRHYLRQIWVAGAAIGAEVPVSRSEKQARLQAAVKTEQVVLRAKR